VSASGRSFETGQAVLRKTTFSDSTPRCTSIREKSGLALRSGLAEPSFAPLVGFTNIPVELASCAAQRLAAMQLRV
jgi:hypothetical protein